VPNGILVALPLKSGAKVVLFGIQPKFFSSFFENLGVFSSF
jgi:hypothetical protein